jgi:general stress protein 26
VVNVAYADPGKDSYVSVSGRADVADDPARKEQLWSKFAQAWFPAGPQDPDLALLRIRIEQADYWDVKESKPTQLFKMAKAAMTGHPPTGLGEHGTVRK